MSGSDTIDLADVAFNANTQATFVGTASGGTLTVTNGTETAKIALTGDYLSSTWTLSNDGNGGTNVVDPAASTDWQMMKVGAGGWAVGLDQAPDGTIGRAHRHQRRLSLERLVLAATRHVEQHAGRLHRRQSGQLGAGRLRNSDRAEQFEHHVHDVRMATCS